MLHSSIADSPIVRVQHNVRLPTSPATGEWIRRFILLPRRACKLAAASTSSRMSPPFLSDTDPVTPHICRKRPPRPKAARPTPSRKECAPWRAPSGYVARPGLQAPTNPRDAVQPSIHEFYPSSDTRGSRLNRLRSRKGYHPQGKRSARRFSWGWPFRNRCPACRLRYR